MTQVATRGLGWRRVLARDVRPRRKRKGVKRRASIQRSSARRLLVYAAGLGAALFVGAVLMRFLTTLAIIRAYDADFSRLPTERTLV